MVEQQDKRGPAYRRDSTRAGWGLTSLNLQKFSTGRRLHWGQRLTFRRRKLNMYVDTVSEMEGFLTILFNDSLCCHGMEPSPKTRPKA
jgi:hypothetical protein